MGRTALSHSSERFEMTPEKLAKKIYLEQIRYKKILHLVDHDYDFPFESMNPDKQAEYVNLATWIMSCQWKDNTNEQNARTSTGISQKV